MALTRQERLSIHKKQERLQVRSGVPHVRDLMEGVPVLRSTSEGIVEYIRYNGVLYKKVFSRSGDGNIGLSARTGDITATAGNMVIISATKGIVHTNSGNVTQGTSITTAVTINASSGIITMHATAIAADENIEFTVTNSTVQADSVILMTMQDENTINNTQLVCAHHTIASGSFIITVANTDSGQDSSGTAVKIHFLVINNS